MDQDNMVECMVLVAGDRGVSKTTLVEKFLHGDVSWPVLQNGECNFAMEQLDLLSLDISNL